MFGKRLALLRKNKKISQYKLAEILNLSRGQIANYEQGQRHPDFDTLQIFADYFDVSTDYLIGRIDDPTPPKKPDTLDYDAIVLAAPNLPEAVVISAALEAKYKLPKSWLYAVWEKATKKFGVPEPVKDSELAAHHNGLPGTGIFEEKE